MLRPQSPAYSTSTRAPCVLAWQRRRHAVSWRTFRERPPLIRIGTRGSALALAQAQEVVRALEAAGEEAELVPIKTADRRDGDDKSRFVRQIDEALLRGDVDLGVHSAKD